MPHPTDDIEYLLAIAEEEHQRRAAFHLTRLRMARIERHADICARLRAEIHRLMRAPFSWQVRA
jgi:hypothetical protein